MTRRQTMASQPLPSRWIIFADPDDPGLLDAARRLPRKSGVLLLQQSEARTMRRLHQLARERALLIVPEGSRSAIRVHNMRELRQALLARTPLILLSPIYPTRSHPDWPPLPRMRAAALARLAGRRLIALGGMDERRYARVAQLGFTGWAGISAFRI